MDLWPLKGPGFDVDFVWSNLSLLLSLLGQEHCLDVGEDTTLGNGDMSQELVQLLVVADSQLKMTGDDPGLLVVTGSVASKLKNLSREVLHDGSQVHGGTGTDTLCVVTLAEMTMDTTNGELETSPVGTGLCLSLDLASFAASRHDCCFVLSFVLETD
jgi:hypothetical protein